jgi:DNA-binding transcriptional LysR family regulator
MDGIPIRYSLRQLRYFIATAETLSFTAAAKRLHISQPSISTALAELESSFGVQLFVRHHASGLSLTQPGRDLLVHARSLLKSAEELQLTAQELDGGISGTISLGCLVSLAPPLMPSLISAFLREHSAITFMTTEAHQDGLLNGLRDGSLDIALTYNLDIAEGVSFVPLVSLPPYVILPKGHRLARAAKVSLKDLLPEPYVMLDLPHSREYFSALFDASGSRPVAAFRSAQPDVVRGMVANGLGYSILNFPLKCCRTVDGEEFVVKRFRDPVPATTLGIAMSNSVRQRAVVKRFAAFCEDYIRRLRFQY